jgi:heterodisulfide reductase subunit A-like polyferredoxin
MSQPEASKQPTQSSAPVQQAEPLREGIFVCHCDLNIAGTLNFKAVAGYPKSMSHLLYSARVKAVAAQIRREAVEKRMVIEVVQ